MGKSPADAKNPPLRSIEDRYDVVKKLGEGASAETFLAHDRERDGEAVVIKSLHVDRLEGWKFFELFQREARTLSGLKHFGIPAFVETFASRGEDTRPRFHLVQDYVEGRPLEEIIDGGGMSEAEFDQLALGMLDILHYLHTRSPPVFHRDIKPSNIIVRPMGAPVLVDFGSVCYGWREEDERGSTVAGTHGYMPPEQYLGQVSARSDVYGLGATLLHVASGRAPSEFSFDEGRLQVPDALPVRPAVRRAISAMLEPAPRDRPESAMKARSLFVVSDTRRSEGGSPATAIVRSSPSHISPVSLADQDAPRFVDLGPPPRSPEGEFRDVYLTLCPRFTSPHGLSGEISREGQKPHVVLFVFLLICTAGVWPLICLLGGSERDRRDQLFRQGRFARATVRGVAGAGQNLGRVSYEFEVDGRRVRSSTLVGSADCSHMVAGDVFGVLYNIVNPRNNTLVYR
jgi:serine/threonine protein kinase